MGEKETCNLTLIRGDGSMFSAQIESIRLSCDSRGPILRVALSDTTERRTTEEKLKKEQDFTRLLLNTSAAFFVVIGADGRTITMNQALLDVLEYTGEEVKGADYLATFVPEEDRFILSGIFREIIDKDQATVNENRIISKSGKIYLVE
jgi:PAS domain S-box-containing protein